MTTFKLKLQNLGQSTRRRFSSDVIDDHRKIIVESVPNYKISRKPLSELRPKFLSVSNGRDFYYIIDNIKIEDVNLTNQTIKTLPTTKADEKQTKDNFNISKSKQIFDNSQIKRLDNLRDQENIFKTKIDTNIDITDRLKKITLFFPGRDTLFIKMPKDPNQIGAKFILKGIKPLNQGDFVKV